MKRFLLGVVALVGLAEQAAAEASPREVTLLVADQTKTTAHALANGSELWVVAEELPGLIGFSFKPEGVCRDDRCIAVSTSDGPWYTQHDGTTYVHLNAVAKALRMPLATDAEFGIYSLGEAQLKDGTSTVRGKAPDFVMRDRDGNEVKLSDFRGKKVLVLTWASWCGCSMDLPNWETIYQDLRGKGFEILAAAQDTGGEDAAGRFYDRAEASFTTVIDPDHTVSTAFQMVNVPTGVWIDEEGTIVRPPEVAYAGRYKVLGREIGDEEYVEGLRDWVENGAESPYVMATPKLQEKLAPRSFEQRLADAEFKLGTYFYQQGLKEPARRHCAEAQRLNPDNWNYHRQDWTFNGSEAVIKWLAKVRALGDKPYYEPVEFPESP